VSHSFQDWARTMMVFMGPQYRVRPGVCKG
jgi:hypothetical protein